ncbi:2-methylisocitrate lyase [Pedobacter psychrophilus]|uniref:2-methylisocitrate lyase n=1 Tax=Pedobacter psychrophilus TaxID=1826909 RepID=A0A179DNJ9_9SPHI|nr:paraquat-inducible protein A [Pedobacter psychrophilus]OAQ42093.1 2-methylisocitrate lyase [Pedobacter psychrophilus]
MSTEQKSTSTKKFGLASIFLILGLSVLLFGEAYFGYHLHTLSAKQESIKEDYSLSNNITFGIFSIDQWRDKIATVVNGQVTDFKITSAQKKSLQTQVETALHGMITKTVNEINKPQKSLGSKLKKFAFNKFVEPKELQALVPGFAKTIIDKVSSPASVKRLKNIATSRIDKLESETYDSTGVVTETVTKALFKKYNVTDAAAYDKEINRQLTDIRAVTYNYAYGMLGCVLLAFALWFFMRKQVHLQTILFVMSLLFAIVLLTVGLTASIIEVEARLASLSFAIMGQKIEFVNQVLFFQSKSLWGVITALIQQSKPDAIVVGVLLLVFVVIFPLLRMIARGIHLVAPPAFAENKVIRYLAFQSGHWDMADVMVVGIIMTYIGLNGILKSQLTGLNFNNEYLVTHTVNQTSLQPGYFIFVGYVVVAYTLSYILKRISPHTH